MVCHQELIDKLSYIYAICSGFILFLFIVIGLGFLWLNLAIKLVGKKAGWDTHRFFVMYYIQHKEEIINIIKKREEERKMAERKDEEEYKKRCDEKNK